VNARFFEGLASSEKRVVLAAAIRRQLAKGMPLTTQSARADYLYLLIQGRARYFFTTEDGQKRILLWVPPGEIIGSAAILPSSARYIVSTEAVKPSVVLAWKHGVIRGLAGQFPRLMENALSSALDYLKFYVASHVALTCHTAPQRVAGLLSNLAWGFGRKTEEGIELDVTNEDVASAANVSYFTASRLLSDWHRQGILAKKRGKIVLLALDKLLVHCA
jgi:CRP-like cAMP-binding protein